MAAAPAANGRAAGTERSRNVNIPTRACQPSEPNAARRHGVRYAHFALLSAFALGATAAAARATSSSTIWTNMTPDIQAFGVVHLGVDNYFTLGRTVADGAGDFPTDVGLTVGILPFEELQMEVGVDLLEPSDDPLSANFKLGAPEGTLFQGAPALFVGMFGIGTEHGVTDYNVAHLTVGKTIPGVGRLSAGPYWGNGDLLRSATGEREDNGFMVAFDRGFRPVTDAAGSSYNRFVLAADYASGENAIGGYAAGLYTYFSRDVALLVAPVWFNDEGINGKWKLTVQLDVTLPPLAGR